MKYKVQLGKLNGKYKTILDTTYSAQAWALYFKTNLECGEKKRIQEIPTIGNAEAKTLNKARRYWTQGYGER